MRGRKPKLTREQMEHVLSLYRLSSCSMERIARHFSVSPGVIIRIVEGRYRPKEEKP